MISVDTFEGIGYGFRVIAYLFLVFLLVGVSIWFGSTLVPDQIRSEPQVNGMEILIDLTLGFVGVVLVFLGAAILWAGLIGTSYKVIVDAVKRGNEASS